MESSVFTDKSKAPDEDMLMQAMGNMYSVWADIREYVFAGCSSAVEEWNYSKLGWNYRIKDKKRVIIYMMPGDKAFRASFVLGEKATQHAMANLKSEEIKDIISSAKVYAEGRGVRIEVNKKKTAEDIKKLVDAKLLKI